MTHHTMAQTIVEEFGLRFDPLGVWMSYTKPNDAYEPAASSEGGCVVSILRMAPLGRTIALDTNSHMCPIGHYFMGFADAPPTGADAYFAGGGEHLKADAELAAAHLHDALAFPREEPYCLIARLDVIPDDVQPEVVITFADADSLSALVTLANYDRVGSDNVIAPFASGCCSLINEPLKEAASPEPRAVVGMFDVMVRHLIDGDILSFAVPYPRMLEMLENIDKSFMRQAYWRALMSRKRQENRSRARGRSSETPSPVDA